MGIAHPTNLGSFPALRYKIKSFVQKPGFFRLAETGFVRFNRKKSDFLLEKPDFLNDLHDYFVHSVWKNSPLGLSMRS